METQSSLSLRECLIGPRGFYRRVATIVLPIIVQNTLSNVVSLLDNVMVGQVGTLPMSAVAVVNQLLFVFYLCIFGSISGAGIYGAQFYGQGNMDGVRQTFRIKLVTGTVLTLGALALFCGAGPRMISLYIADSTAAADAAATLDYAARYLWVMLPGLIPFTITQVYAGTLREAGQTTLPMKASITAMAVNFVFNALLIFGLLGFPRLGVVGAGLATALSRFVEMGIVLVGSHRGGSRYPFMRGLYRPFVISGPLAKEVLLKSVPLALNEFLWSLGQATLLQCYSVRGIDVVAAMNICNTCSNLFSTVFLSLGNATAVVVGQELGANRLTDARRTAWRMITLSVASCVVTGAALALCSPVIPHIYNTELTIRLLASECICVVALCMPINGFANCSYFILRSGGKTLITFLFDSCFTCAVSVPAAYLLTRYTGWNIVLVFLIVCELDLLKCLLGFVLVRRGGWVKNIVC